MPSVATIRRQLQQFAFRDVFIEELGWDTLNESPLRLLTDGVTFTLTPVAQKRGVRVLHCSPDAQGQIPLAAVRVKLSHEVTKRSAEHLLVFTDAAKQNQVWLWVRRDSGQSRPRTFTKLDDVAGRLASLEISLEEEMTLLQPHVAGKLKSAFDVEKVTKKFYEVFKKKHDGFVQTIAGIHDGPDREWYASLLLNRLMFVYFMQRKGFMAGDVNYLRQRLDRLTSQYPADAPSFYAFYRQFLLRLFHEGLGQRQRSPQLTALLGDVPYLNGGLFEMHELERMYPTITIPDGAFRDMFDFFDQYQWHLDDRPTKTGNEINPDVLGYIFEKYINNKQMGAYYTKEDITEYIGKNTIIPFIVDRAAQDYTAGFAPSGPVWTTLRDHPDRYIYPAVRHGVDLPLPPAIEAGIDDVVQRNGWNRAAPAEYGLPTETWREHVARRQRCTEIRTRLADGAVTSINDLITLNLNIRQFASDVIAAADAATLRALFGAIRQMTVLDPTCGSGAFLFAALNILEPLYEACLEQMQVLLDDLQRVTRPLNDNLGDFRDVLGEANNRQRHPNRRYFVLKSIMLNNLYGVDIMDEAVEICKLRLFLKLVAQAETSSQIEPLPDIDFNIRAGNTLVGYATYAEVATVIDAKMDVFSAKDAIKSSAQATQTAYRTFRESQSRYAVDPTTLAAEKASLRQHLTDLNTKLDTYLAQEYGVQPEKAAEFARWQESHKPFHWFIEFYDIIEGRGGFDVIIGNPPYVGYSKVKSEYTIKDYQTEPSGNLYSFTIERSLNLFKKKGRIGMIVPIASVSTGTMKELQDLYNNFIVWNSHYGVRPGKLFAGVDMNLTITILSSDNDKTQKYSTKYHRWSDSFPSNRKVLFDDLYYVDHSSIKNHINTFPKIGSTIEKSILQKMLSNNVRVNHYISSRGETMYYHSGGRYWRKALKSKLSSHYKPITVNIEVAPIIFSLLNSQLFYWYWINNSNCMDVVLREVVELPIFLFHNQKTNVLLELNNRLMDSYFSSNTTRHRRGELINVDEINFDVAKSKPIIDEIDRMLAQHYGFTDEELDFIINYDIKYRMGKDSAEDI